MKRLFSILALSLLAISLRAQPGTLASPNPPGRVPGPVRELIPDNSASAPVTFSTNADGSLSISANDVMGFVPTRYRSLVAMLLPLLALVLPRMIHSYKSGGSTKDALSGAFMGVSKQVGNEITQLKQRTALPLTPAPPAALPVTPAPAPVTPLTHLPPTP